MVCEEQCGDLDLNIISGKLVEPVQVNKRVRKKTPLLRVALIEKTKEIMEKISL